MTRRRSPRLLPAAMLLWLLAAIAAPARADETADALLGRVPPDASLALVVEDLGVHVRALVDSPMVEGLADSRPVRGWLDSDDGAKLRRARRDVEAWLGAPLVDLVDGLLGRAVVLSLHLPADAPPEEARGLLQTVVTDRTLLDRFIAAANTAERGSGALVRVESRTHGGVSYSVRAFRDGRPDEAYALLDDGTFVWTNAERLLLGVIDRVADPDRPAMVDRPEVDRVRRALPDRAIARLFVDPRFVGRLAAADPKAPKPGDLPPPLVVYLGAIDALGAALEWREGPVLHVVEAIDPDRLPEPVRSWAARDGGPGPFLGMIPPTALLTAAGHVDAPALYDLAIASVPEDDRPKREALAVALRGVLLGRDPRGEILPAIGPGVVGWIEAPSPGRPLGRGPAVLAAPVADPAAAGAIDNAIRTVLAFVALDQGEKSAARLVVEGQGEARVTALIAGEGDGRTRFAFAVGRGLVVVGTDVDAVAAVLADRGAEGPGPRPAALDARDRLFPDASTFAFVDLDAVRRVLAEGSDGPSRDDLGRLIELLSPFRGAYFTSAMTDDASLARRRLGLIVARPERP